MLEAESLTGGFAQPVFEAQSVFRAVMDGMARPGTHQTVAVSLHPPAPFGLAQAAIALTLCDADSRVWLSGVLTKSAAPAWLSFHTGGVTTTDKTEAQFAFFEAGSPLAAFAQFSTGTQDYPDRSVTVVYEVAGFEGGQPLTLKGPGIQDRAMIAPLGLPDGFLRHWQDNHALFPRGVDVIFTAGRDFLCLPRSCAILSGEA
ncbi:carbon-phosphorus lyase subunit PhnH [Agrobacterium vitis]|uniref:phosphonate C-P lyase system protein PhnH n=1 Tax=Agrobacterium vitis TaxID=373 RepID=UPI0015DC0BAB|nr:carbon-phosphorus lyase subunit PhnH [Agrobacterium vitis]